MGQEVLSKTVKGSAGENKIEIDARALNSGVYFYNVSSGGQGISEKMIIQK